MKGEAQFKQLANAVRVLSMDMVQAAKSGHPGAPMGMADIATVLWREFLRHDPADVAWCNRDRFILSNGHASALLYSLLYLSAYPLKKEDLKNFRQLNSLTPGHPEIETPGVETTTGPLAQGLANAVGMALAERNLASEFNRGIHQIIDHYSYVFCGDGCLMEGLSHEACSLAGNLQLGKLIVFYDDNDITIDGKASDWFGDDTALRFESYGWQVLAGVDGHDATQIRQAIGNARADARPSLIICKTTIGYGSPSLQGSAKVHGAPLGEDEIIATRKNLGWQYPAFEIPPQLLGAWSATARGKQINEQWQDKFNAYSAEYPDLAQEFTRRIKGELKASFATNAQQHIQLQQQKSAKVATRKSSQQCIEAYAPDIPEFLGGSADLTASNLTRWSTAKTLDKQNPGNYLYYGVREFAMAAIMNGVALHGGYLPFGGTFLVFSDYMRNAMRLSALMKSRVIYVLTHDSIGVGEDGPTHQPVEHLAMLRLTPNLNVWRPADGAETAVAWQQAITSHNAPSVLALSRQSLPSQERTAQQLAQIKRGAYILIEPDADELQAIVIASGSEVAVAAAAVKQLNSTGHALRLVSMPCCEIFDQQNSTYKQKLLPPTTSKRLALEAGAGDYWYKYVGLAGKVIAVDSFGKSAPAEQLMDYFGLTATKVCSAIVKLLND